MNVLNELKNWMIENNDDDTPLHPSDIYKKIDELVASKPSVGKSAEEVERWYRKWMADRGKSGIATVNVLDMLKDFASQYAHQQPVPSNWNRPLEVTDLVEYPSTHQQPVHNKYSGYDTRTVIEFNLSKDGKYLDRNDKEITTEMLTNHYQIIHEDWGILFIDAQQPVQGYSMEQVNEAMDKIETMEALENTMKPQYQQPVNDGWVRVDSGELPDYRLVVDVYKSHHNVVEPAARLSTDITGEKWSCEYGHYITHWRLRPEPPKQ